MADDNLNMSVIFTQQDMENIALAVFVVSQATFKAWQEDVNNIEAQNEAEVYRELIIKFLPISQGLQGTLQRLSDKFDDMSDEEKEAVRSEIKKSDLQITLEGLEGF
jgi:hypothetical protein